MSPGLLVGFVASALLHLAVLLFLLFGLPAMVPKEAEEPPETAVAMVFQSGANASLRAPAPADGSVPAPQPAPPAEALLTPPQPVEPPPSPPPPPLARVQLPVPTPPSPVPPPIPTPTPQAAKAEPPAPVPSPLPPPPAPPPPTPPREPPPPLPPPPHLPSVPSSAVPLPPNVTKNAVSSSGSVESTLDKLRQQLAQTQPPKPRPSGQSGGQPNTGGNPLGSDTAALSAAERGAIGDHVRECWTKDAGALDIDRQRVLLTVRTDANGIARQAEVAGEDKGRMSDPRFRAFAERAMRAIMDARCANLPLPANALGKINVLTFRFSP